MYVGQTKQSFEVRSNIIIWLLPDLPCEEAIMLLPPLTHSFPNRSLPWAPVWKRQRTFSSYWSLSSRKQKRKMHTSRIELKNLKEYHLQLQQVCNVCVCMCVCEQMCMYSECMQAMLTSSIAGQCDWKKWPSTVSLTSHPLPHSSSLRAISLFSSFKNSHEKEKHPHVWYFEN